MCFAFLARLAVLFMLGRHINPELWEYDIIARNILSGKGYLMHWFNTDYHSFAYPLYPYFSAAFLFVFKHNYFAVELTEIALSSGACFFIYAITKKVFDERVAFLSSFLVAAHPGLIIYSTKVHEFNLVVFFLAFGFWAMLHFDRNKVSYHMLMGAITGIGILLRPSFLFFFIAYAIYAFSAHKKVLKKAANILIAALITILAITPWSVRNYILHKRLIFISTSSAEHFWRGNNPLASGTALTIDNHGILDVAPKEFTTELYSLNEIGQYDLFYKETIRSIKLNPGHFLKMCLKKFYYFWWFSPQTGLLYPKAWTLIYRAYYGVIVFLFIAGGIIALKRIAGSRKAAIFSFFITFILFSLLHSLYYVETRHRWAIEPFMLIFTAYAVVVFYENFTQNTK